MSALKLEAGKYYRTRDKRRAYVAAVGCPFGGAQECEQGIGWIEGSGEHSWTTSGRFFGDKEEANADLVAEWREPREWTVYVYDHHDGCFATSLALLQDTRYKLLARVVVREGEGVE
jgi:hypothetical protein